MLTLIATVFAVAVTIPTPVVVRGGDQIVRVKRVLSDRRLILCLAATLKIGVGQIQAVLVDLDVPGQVLRTATLTGWKIVERSDGGTGPLRRRVEFRRQEARQVKFLLIAQLGVERLRVDRSHASASIQVRRRADHQGGQRHD